MSEKNDDMLKKNVSIRFDGEQGMVSVSSQLFITLFERERTSDIVEGQRNYKSKIKKKIRKNVQAWPRTLLQART